jgi:hypothetical protein
MRPNNLGDIFQKKCAQIVWAIFFRKNASKGRKMRPNDKFSPNLVTLKTSFNANFLGSVEATYFEVSLEALRALSLCSKKLLSERATFFTSFYELHFGS